jgi:hypothetical protein
MQYTLKSNSLDLTPTMGGPTVRVGRLGDRFSMAFTARSMFYQQALYFISSLNMGMSDKVRMPLPQGTDGYVGSPGTPVVNGAGQAGRNITMRGFSPGYVAEQGQFFNIVSAGVYALYQCTSTQTADGSGNLILPILPIIRIPPSDGDACEFDPPYIEGFLSGNQQSWTLNMAQAVGLNFTILESI